jgi:predicted lipoprotein
MAQAFTKANRIRLIVTGLVVVLLVAMVLNTKFLTSEELAAAGPVRFDPKKTADELFTRAKAELPGQAAELSEVVAALQADPKAAADQFKAVSPGTGTYVFAVRTAGTVSESGATGVRLQVDGIPGETPVQVPLGTAVNGTVLRDAMGFKFADAPGQTDYQYVGDELKKLIQAEIGGTAGDPAALEGKKVDVVGVLSVVSPTGNAVPKAKPVNVQPLTLQATS